MRIALLGSAPSSVQLAPFHDAKYDQFLGGKPPPQYPPAPHIGDDWQIWGVSPGAFGHAQRVDRWFELHRWEPGQAWFSPEYVQFLREFRGPVYTGGVIPEIPNHVVYPIEQVEEVFGPYFLHSSLSLMAAIAILEIEADRAKRPQPIDNKDDIIGFWGVDMAANEEYQEQRSGCHFFINEALRRGIGIYTPPESCLLRPKPVYGLCEWSHDYIKCTSRARELNQRKAMYQQALNEAQIHLATLNGAMDNMNYFINTWTSPYGIPAGVAIWANDLPNTGGGVTLPRPENPPQQIPEK